MASIGQPTEPENGSSTMPAGDNSTPASPLRVGQSATAPNSTATVLNVLGAPGENVQPSDTAVAGAAVLSADSHSKGVSSSARDGSVAPAAPAHFSRVSPAASQISFDAQLQEAADKIFGLMLKPLPVDRSAGDARISLITFIAHVGFSTQELAHMLDSLVRVSRRVEWNHFVTKDMSGRCHA